MLRPARERASSRRPVLSETERSARRTGGGMGFIPQRRRRRRRACGSGAGKPELLQFLAQRSEEHTSELQSQSNLVCRLLLEKKKKKKNKRRSAQHEMMS